MFDKPPSLTTAARTLLVVSLVILGVLIYAFGWQTTEIDLETVKDEERRPPLTRALRELLSPDLFDQETDSEIAFYNFQHGECIQDPLIRLISPIPQADPPDPGQPYIQVSTDCADPDTPIIIEGFNFNYDRRGTGIIRWRRSENQSQPVVRFEVERDGHFIEEIEVPRIRGGGEIHRIEAEYFWPDGSPTVSDTTDLVVEKMIETLFLALMATTVAVPIAAILSFLAARNLMRQLTMPLGNVLVGAVLFPFGWWLGAEYLTEIGRLGYNIGYEQQFDILGQSIDLSDLSPFGGLVSGILLIGLYSVVVRTITSLVKATDEVTRRLTGLVVNTALLLLVIFWLGMAGGLTHWFGDWLHARKILGLFTLNDLAGMLSTGGELADYIMPVLAGIAGAVFLGLIGSTFSLPVLKPVRGLPSYVVAGVLGMLTGAMLIGGLAEFSQQAALLAVLPPLVAAVLGSQVFAGGFDWMMVVLSDGRRRNKEDARDEYDLFQQLLRLSMVVGGSLLVFAIAYFVMNTSRGLVDGRLPLREQVSFLGLFDVYLQTLYGFVLGGILGGLAGAMMGLHARFPLGMVIYNTTRTILNATRSIEPLIMGIVFVIWVGVGPFAGMLALALHSVAALGKLYSEQVENIDAGPIEAIQATGANRLQTVIYAVVPQIVPPYIAFTMYRWDINVRMSTIIGYVGGGGIGFVLQQQINLLRYRDAGVAVLAIAFVVTALDYASAWIRERMI